MADRRDWRDLWLLPAATVLSVLIAALAIYFTVKSNNDTERQRERAAAALSAKDAERAFQLAAVQIVMNQRTCKLAQARARTLVRLFREQLEDVLEPLTHPLLSANLLPAAPHYVRQQR
jgi:hypothetical protein